MPKKIIWLAVSCLMVLSLVMASCTTTTPTPTATTTPTTTPPTTTPTTPTPTPTTPPGGQTSDVPKYGGTFTTAIVADPTNFDSGSKAQGLAGLAWLVYEQYMVADWTRGPAGTGVTDWAAGASTIEDFYMPEIAESWEIPEQGVWVMTIRQGVHWQNVDSDAGRLMGGREVTADDVVSSLHRLLASPSSWMNLSQPAAAAAITIEKTGPWEVTLKTPVDYLSSFFWITTGGGFNYLYPPEVVAAYGSVADWHNAVGTGPFMISDYVPASTMTFVRNPDYWQTDPIGPGKGNQLPYVDKYQQLIIPDWSTRIAGVRTGKLDNLLNLTRDQYETLVQTSPQVMHDKFLSNLPYEFAMRTDLPDLPYSDVRVRQALMYATDFNSIKNDFYVGDAETLVYPVNKNFNDAYTPLDQMPADVQDLFNYNPDKAKELLTEAGYPDGFKATVVVENIPDRVDEVSIYKDMWAKVGVDLVLDTYETGAYTGLSARRAFDEMLYRFNWSAFPMIFYFSSLRGPSVNNPSRIDDPIGADKTVEDTFQAINKVVFVDNSQIYSNFKTMDPYLVQQSYVIPRPTPYTYNVWWPWLKNYHGEPVTGGFGKFYWIDQTLKKSMGY